MTNTVTPFSLKNSPALIEQLLPVQKLSAEVYKERKAGSGQTLTALGSYWRGRKPLILAKACVLGCLLPATDQPQRDLEVFEKLMGMDDESFAVPWKQRPRPHVGAALSNNRAIDYVTTKPTEAAPSSNVGTTAIPISSRSDLTEVQRRRLEAKMLPQVSYRERVNQAKRPEEVIDVVHDHIWDAVNEHLGTSATSMPELVQQLGIMRFGHRPRVADTFCGSGQIPFEAARIGCDVYASDLNPVACMLTWGAFNIVGATAAMRHDLQDKQREIAKAIDAQIDELGIEADGLGWRAKAFLYCLETKCPQTGWAVPLLPSLIVSRGYSVVAELVPDEAQKRYDILIKSGASEAQMLQAQQGTVRSDGRGQDPFLVHSVGGVEYRTKLSTLRGDYRKEDGSTGNRLRPWENSDIAPRPDDILQERLYCIQWMRPKNKGRGDEYDFRGVTPDDLTRERVAEEFVSEHFADWQSSGFVPNMRIEPGDKTDEPIRTRGACRGTTPPSSSCYRSGCTCRSPRSHHKLQRLVTHRSQRKRRVGHRDSRTNANHSAGFYGARWNFGPNKTSQLNSTSTPMSCASRCCCEHTA